VFHHLTLGTDDIARGGAFYDAVLAPLGLVRTWDDVEQDGWLCWQLSGKAPLGPETQPGFWLCRPTDGGAPSAGNGATVAFAAPTRAAVRDFHAAALAAGGRCEGPPGLRPHYGERYYGTYVRDPAGNKIAAVCRRPDVWWQDLKTCTFGTTPQIQTQLAHLVAIGVKRATTGIHNGIATESGPGQQWLVVDGHARPVCVIETTQVEILPFDTITPVFAAEEGEGDGSFAYWHRVHEHWLRTTCPDYAPDMLVEAERFRLVEVVEPDALPARAAILAEEARSARSWLGG
jgi:uncharacterized protein YhfF/catechol 2,3-dioxygenase-like lactoylglutathione lyase family enzyme